MNFSFPIKKCDDSPTNKMKQTAWLLPPIAILVLVLNTNASTSTTITSATVSATTTIATVTTTVTARVTEPGVSPCTVSRNGQLISCHGVNTTSLLLFLSRLRHTNTTTATTTQADDNTTTTAMPTQDENNHTVNNSDSNSRRRLSPVVPPVVRELSLLSCRLPNLTSDALLTPEPLEVVSVVSSEVAEVDPDTFTYHQNSLTRLILAFNFLTAVPRGIANLTLLEFLDLRHNLIDHLPPAVVFSRLRRLRHLHLDHNKLGQVTGGSGEVSSGVRVLQPLGVLDASLTHLTLAHNLLPANLTTPPFTTLTLLNLAHNKISDVPAGSLSQLINLQYLDLSDNLLRSLSPASLPPTLLSLSLRGNPWNCTCESRWLLAGNTPATTTTPSCATPLHVRHQTLASLPESVLCPPHVTSSDTEIIYVGDQVDGPLRDAMTSLHLMNVTSLNHQALLVSWLVEASFYSPSITSLEPLSWAIMIREAKQEARAAKATRMKLSRYRKQRPNWKPADSVFTEVLDGLQAETMYVLCLSPVQDERIYYIRPDHCLHGSTLPKIQHKMISSPSQELEHPSVIPKISAVLSTAHYSVKTEMVTITSASHSVDLSWNVTVFPHHQSFVLEGKMLRPLGWRITYRRFSEKEETEVVLVSRGGEPLQNFTNQYSIRDLKPRTGYVFCFHSLTDTEINEILAKGGGSEDAGSSSIGARLQNMTPAKSSRSDFPLSTVQTARGRSDHPTHSQPSPSAYFLGGTSDPTQDNLGTSDPLWHEPKIFSTDYNGPSTTNPVYNDPRNAHPSLHNPSTANPFSQSSLITNPVWNDPRNDNPLWQDSKRNSPTEQDPINSGPVVEDPWTTKSSEQEPTPIFSTQGTGRSFHRNPPSVSSFPSSSNIPPVPNLPPLPSNRPPRPPRPDSGGNFVYTSTGERIRLPSFSPGAGSPFNVPVVGPAIIPTSEKPRQRYIYEFDDNDTTTEEPASNETTTSERKQIFTYETTRRRKRSLNTETPIQYEKFLDSGVVQICREVVTLAAYDELITPLAIASTVSSTSTVAVIVLFCCCCWPRRCGRKRKKEGWTSKRTYTPRQISNISAPSPINVFSGHTSMMNGGSVVGEREGGLTNQEKTSRSISVASNSGYLTPLQLPNGVTLDPSSLITEGRVPPNQRAYLNLLKDRLLQKHKDNPEFHPGYDIPPQSHPKTMLGYDYPHPTPVNPIGGDVGREAGNSKVSPALPSPSSSNDSNYNANIATTIEKKKEAQVNLNIPLTQDKRSNISKSMELNEAGLIEPHGSISGDYNYINTGGDIITDSSQVTYFKNPPKNKNNRHRKFGFPKKDSEGQLSPDCSLSKDSSPGHLSRSVPDLANPEEVCGSQPRSPVSLQSYEDNGYANVSSMLTPNNNDSTNQGDGQARMQPEMYHTWSSTRQSPPKGHPSLGEVILTGGTLIEVPEGYVVPKPPKPAPCIKLLVKGESEKEHSLHDVPVTKGSTDPPEKEEPTNLPPAEKEPNKKRPPTPKKTNEKSQITHLMTPETDINRLVINTGIAI